MLFQFVHFHRQHLNSNSSFILHLQLLRNIQTFSWNLKSTFVTLTKTNKLYLVINFLILYEGGFKEEGVHANAQI